MSSGRRTSTRRRTGRASPGRSACPSVNGSAPSARAPRDRARRHDPEDPDAQGSSVLRRRRRSNSLAIASPLASRRSAVSWASSRRLDVLGDLGVGCRELVDAALPRAGVLVEVAVLDGRVEELLDAADEGQRGLRGRAVPGVVRDGGPRRDGRRPPASRHPRARRRCPSGPRSCSSRGRAGAGCPPCRTSRRRGSGGSAPRRP